MILATGAALSLLVLGFILFASIVTRPPAPNNAYADGIVVLTGEGQRIAEGARLLTEGRAKRMLISGVYRRTGKRALLKITKLPEEKFDCCVDLGYAALDTTGNAAPSPPQLAELRQRGIFATRQLAKRQLTWLRSMPERMVVPGDAPDAQEQILRWAHDQLKGKI